MPELGEFRSSLVELTFPLSYRSHRLPLAESPVLVLNGVVPYSAFAVTVLSRDQFFFCQQHPLAGAGGKCVSEVVQIAVSAYIAGVTDRFEWPALECDAKALYDLPFVVIVVHLD
jgi:hypothetical protein